MLLAAGLFAASGCSTSTSEASREHGGSDRHLAILCYHDISAAANAPLLTVSPEFLRAQIRACRKAGWTFIALDQVIAHREHPEALPPRAIVMTFDDGYRSFRKLALPILREEHVPATLAVITGFVDHAPSDMAPLMNWDELNEVARDPLVTLVSHAHALHRYETSNPYRDTEPAIATRRYILAQARYENREEYRGRVRADLDTARQVFTARLHRAPNVLVWPYGAQNEMACAIAALAGFPVTLGLGSGEITARDLRQGLLPRIMVHRKFHFDRGDAAWLNAADTPVRAASVDLDDVYSRDPRVFDDRVNQLVARVRAVGANTVFLSVCSDSASTGEYTVAWCMNHQVRVRADIWSMVASRLSQARIRVWARVPSMNLSWAWQQHPEWRISDPSRGTRRALGGEPSALATRWPNRLSPDLAESRRAAIDFVSDLAVYAPLDGVVFDDDAAMAANERLAMAGSAEARDKALAIEDLLNRCRDAVRTWRPDCSFARVVDADAVPVTGADPAHAQDFSRIAGDYDVTVVSVPVAAGPDPDAPRRVERLARRAIEGWRSELARLSGAGIGTLLGNSAGVAKPPMAPVLFEFDAYDATSSRWLDAPLLRELMAATGRGGIPNVGLASVSPALGDLPAALLGAKASPDLAGSEASGH